MLIRIPFIRRSLSRYQKNRRLRDAFWLFIATHRRVRVSPSEMLNEGSGSTVIAGRKRRREGRTGKGGGEEGEERKGEEKGGRGRKREEGGGRGRKREEGGGRERKGEGGGGRWRKGEEGGGRWRKGRRREG